MARQAAAVPKDERVTVVISRAVRDALKVVAAANKMLFADYMNQILEREISTWEKKGFRFEKTRPKQKA